jgi:hypothetical protein
LFLEVHACLFQYFTREKAIGLGPIVIMGWLLGVGVTVIFWLGIGGNGDILAGCLDSVEWEWDGGTESESSGHFIMSF